MENKRTLAQQQQYIESKQAEAEALIASALQSVPTILHPDKYCGFLNCCEKFYRYSALNNILIFNQYPEATYIAGYDLWTKTVENDSQQQSKLVLKPESRGKGIQILAPFTSVSQRIRQLIYFPVAVYDIAQTTRSEVPESPLFDMNDITITEIIDSLKTTCPYHVVLSGKEDKNLSFVRSYCNHQLKLIIVDEAHKTDDQLRLLLKEYATLFLHKYDFSNLKLCNFMIESAAYILYKHYNVLASDTSFFSLSNNFIPYPSSELFAAFQYMQQTIQRIIEDVDDKLYNLIQDSLEEEISIQPT